MDLDTFRLLDLMPRFMRDDETTVALCKAIEAQMKNAVTAKNDSLILPFIEDAPEWLLDELAWERNITWYDTAAPVDVKRRVIQSSYFVKRHLGTAAAVERTIADYFGDGSIEEWFEYGGQPYMFRVYTTNSEATEEQADMFRLALNATKNVRSHLESIIVNRRADMHQYVAITYHEGEVLTKYVGGP